MSKETIETLNPFLMGELGIKTAGFRKYKKFNQYKKKIQNNQFVKEVLIDEQMVNTFIDKELLESLYSGGHTKNTMSVFFALVGKLNYNEDIITLNTNDIAEMTGYKKSSINQAIKDLIELKVISRISGRLTNYKYYINPMKIFSGNNIEFIKSRNPNLVKSTLTKAQIIP